MTVCLNYVAMRASNWKNRNVNHSRGNTLVHKVNDITIFTAYKSPTAIISLNAIKNDESDRPDIYLQIAELTVSDLE